MQPYNALQIAELENDIGITGSYYFRSVPRCFDKKIIRQISELDHEIGYHYENLVICKGDFECAIKDFEKNLERFRKIVPVKTICMHGSPLNRCDSRLLWKKYDYRDFGIIGEPYFDIDFTKVLYLTDTGRRWDGEKFSVRDKVLRSNKVNKKSGEAENKNLKTDENTVFLSDKYKFRSTFDIIRAAEKNELPDKIMINMHPQRWTDKPLPWLKEYVGQNVKNVIKRFFFVKKF
ncbi:MAG: hypothetical protein JW723_15515 [Bacteroidales bacterium]|nr:hypothetical protein [Bacteroidales bacterium]